MAFPPENLKIWVDSREYLRQNQTATYPPFTKGTKWVKALKVLPHLALLPVWGVSKNCRRTATSRTIPWIGKSNQNVSGVHTDGGYEPIQGFPPAPKTQV